MQLGVAQFVCLGPLAPLRYRIVYIGYALCSGGAICHLAIVLHSQVGIQRTHRLLVARTSVILAHFLVAVQLRAYHAKHIVAEHTCIHAQYHKRLKALVLRLGKHPAHLGR